MHNETLNPDPDAGNPALHALNRDLPAGPLIDKYGRQISYVRLSITDRCDFRCTYCMSEKMTFLPRDQIMSLEECLRVAQVFVGLGVSKLRITGGEPLVRPNALWLLQQLGQLDGLRELVLTTNGSQLDRYAPALRDAGVRRLNISLDTLDAERFRSITRIGSLEKVLQGIAAARQAGFMHTKLNVVMMRGFNDDEFGDLVRFALDQELDISFIEEMPLGAIAGRSRTYISSQETLARLQADFELVPSAESSGGPARYWRIPGRQTRIGFISPHSHNFCGTCNRVRITARGELYPCLGHNDATALLPLLRQHPDDDAAVRQAIMDSMGLKPKAHDFTQQMEVPQVVRFMSMTGG
ncbi:GTP 3',8-cyclase MoaA [Azovibrio restrictus]|uniref:GTP 3',8-cyclase MoaA n=1 Tax=Azovibrio restrictus TaxID=146938 RepID=UPI0026EE60F8|nr:GTP 3',8-cyclase MoaA [Azovibrio restrictus]